MSAKEEDPMSGVELDFSIFHPLDHTLEQCAGYPGGRARHQELNALFGPEGEHS